jgi:phosphate starvation-inducible membrane PsiE
MLNAIRENLVNFLWYLQLTAASIALYTSQMHFPVD